MSAVKKIGDFVRRIGRRNFLILCFIPFGGFFFYHDGLPGLLAAIFGWWLGGILYEWKDSKRRLKNFLRRRSRFQIKAAVHLIIFIPIAAVCSYHYGWKGFLTVCAGWCVGEFISRRFLKLN